ncbi:ABC transporter permease [Spirillospora sp. NPDC029432]|uniref:ABC transporter permease n=1 Tax=Spirillospora sp. NPDC029432 TaxID=3154599 RepID=UPI003453E3E9
MTDVKAATAEKTAGAARKGAGKPGAGRGLRLLGTGIGRLWLFVLLMALWEVVTRIANGSFFPPPSEIVAALHEIWFSGPASDLFLTEKAIEDFKPSFTNLFTGWAIAAVSGVLLGLLIGRSRLLGDLLDPLLQFLRAVPPPTMIPFLLVILDLDGPLQITTIAFGVVWPVLLNTIDGMRTVDRLQLETARVFGITGLTRLRRVILPAAAPKIFAGLRVSLGFALILMVISELIGQTSGIGAHLVLAQQSFELAEMWAGIVLLGVLGCLFNMVFLLVERRALRWHVGAKRLAD